MGDIRVEFHEGVWVVAVSADIRNTRRELALLGVPIADELDIQPVAWVRPKKPPIRRSSGSTIARRSNRRIVPDTEFADNLPS